jgi:hypothetical protein
LSRIARLSAVKIAKVAKVAKKGGARLIDTAGGAIGVRSRDMANADAAWWETRLYGILWADLWTRCA